MERLDFYLLPFMKPGYVRNVFVNNVPETYADAVREIIKREKIDYNNKEMYWFLISFMWEKRKEVRKPVIRKYFP